MILYQEQVLRIAHEIGGFTLGEADVLRRAMSKFRSAHEMVQLRQQFIDGAQSISRIAASTAEKIWDLMAAFAGYGFPKAHAAGYAAVAYRMAYLKTHFPAEFMAARLAVSGGFYSPRVYMAEARQLGLKVKPPHVNHSVEVFNLDSVDRTMLWMGLGQVRDLTHTTIKSIIAQRPFTSIEDFLIRAQPQYIEAVNLANVNAFDGLRPQPEILALLDHDRWHGRHSAQLDLIEEARPAQAQFSPGELAGSQASTPLHSAQGSDNIPLEQRAKWEEEILGYWVDIHPAQLAAQHVRSRARILSNELDRHSGQEVMLIGLRMAMHRLQDQSKESRLLIDLEDEVGTFQVLWSGEALRQHRSLIQKREPLLIRGKVRIDRQGQLVVVGSEAKLIASF